jgi:hypothetical protein
MAITSIKDADAALSLIEKSLRSEMESINRGLADWEHTQLWIGEKDFIIRGLSKMDERRSVFEQELAALVEKQDIKATNKLHSRLLKIKVALNRVDRTREKINWLRGIRRDIEYREADIKRLQPLLDILKNQFERELSNLASEIDNQVSAEPVQAVEVQQESTKLGSFVRNLMSKGV